MAQAPRTPDGLGVTDQDIQPGPFDGMNAAQIRRENRDQLIRSAFILAGLALGLAALVTLSTILPDLLVNSLTVDLTCMPQTDEK